MKIIRKTYSGHSMDKYCVELQKDNDLSDIEIIAEIARMTRQGHYLSAYGGRIENRFNNLLSVTIYKD